MAEVKKNRHIVGGIGPVIYRVYNGKNIIQSRPLSVKQTKETRASGKEFGNASKLSKTIRQSLAPITLGFNDTKMYYRFTSALYQTLVSNKELPKGIRSLEDGNLNILSHFQLNSESPFSDYFSLETNIILEENNTIRISLPEFVIRDTLSAPKEAAEAALCFFISCNNPKDGTPLQTSFHRLNMPLMDLNHKIPSQQWETAVLPANCLVFITAALMLYQKDLMIGSVNLNSKLLHPSEIVAVLKTNAILK